MKRTNYYFPEPMLAALKELALRTKMPASEHIRRAITAYLKKQTKEQS